MDEARVEVVYRSELADALGNLLSRTIALLRRHTPPSDRWQTNNRRDDAEPLVTRARDLQGAVDEAVGRFATDDALRDMWSVIGAANKHLADTAPWAVAKEPGGVLRARRIIEQAAFALDAVARALAPFLPVTARTIATALEDPTAPCPILFPKERLPGDRCQGNEYLASLHAGGSQSGPFGGGMT